MYVCMYVYIYTDHRIYSVVATYDMQCVKVPLFNFSLLSCSLFLLGFLPD